LTASFGNEEARIDVAGRLRFRLSSHERLADGLRQCVRVATRPTEDDWSRFVLPKWAEPFYAVLRPWRLIRKHGIRQGRGSLAEVPSSASDAVYAAPPEIRSRWIEERR
jgi:hypothetical protein